MGQNGRFSAENVASARLQLKKKPALFSAHDIFNSNEGDVMYICFPSHALRSTKRQKTYERVKYGLIATFSVLADWRKGPLVTIGTSKKPRSFPHHFDALYDLCVLYQTQKNA